MQLSRHFTLDEMTRSQTAARRGISNQPSAEHLENLRTTCGRMENVRRLLGAPIIVSSGYRSPELNRAIGGSERSSHSRGLAVDFVCPGFGSPLEICRAIRDDNLAFDQLIYEGTWVHLGFDSRMRRQVLTAHFENGKASYTSGLPHAAT